MFRHTISYALTSLILISQVGVPLHMHYCKGILESVSVLFAAKCNDHDVPANLPACCKKAFASHCIKKEGKKCCDDEVKVIKQDITSITPSFVKWVDLAAEINGKTTFESISVQPTVLHHAEGNTSDSGPPIYILHQALIFYA